MKKIFILLLLLGLTFIFGCSFINERISDVYNENNSMQQGEELIDSTNHNNNDDNLNEHLVNNEESTDWEIEENQEERYTTLYYQDTDGLIIPITRRTPRIEGIAKAAVYALVDVPAIREDIGRVGLYPVLPKDTYIHGMTIKDGVATVDFSAGILEYDTALNEKNILTGLIYTLTEFDTINSVNILVDGMILSNLKYAKDVKFPLLRREINNIGYTKDALNIDKEQVEVYYTKLINNKYLFYVPVSRFVDKSTSDADRYMKTLNELFKGDIQDKGLKTYIPEKTKLNGIQDHGQTVIIDFNDEILNATHSSTSFETMLNQILLCFKQFGKVKKVKVNVNGKPMEFIGSNKGQDTLEVPLYINKF